MPPDRPVRLTVPSCCSRVYCSTELDSLLLLLETYSMEQYTSEDARREWRRILNAVENGERVEITRYGKPLAAVVPVGASIYLLERIGGTDYDEAEFLAEIQRRRTASYEVATDLVYNVGEDAERAFGKVDAYDDVIRLITSLGASFPSEPAKPSRAWHAGWEPIGRDSDGNLMLRYKPTDAAYRVLPVEES